MLYVLNICNTITFSYYQFSSIIFLTLKCVQLRIYATSTDSFGVYVLLLYSSNATFTSCTMCWHLDFSFHREQTQLMKLMQIANYKVAFS